MVSQKNSPGDILEVRGKKCHKKCHKTLFIFETIQNEKSFFKNLKTDFHHLESCFILRDYYFLCRNPFKEIMKYTSMQFLQLTSGKQKV